ncbi:MAG: InlB B-repeat-containing protein, partial [Tissierellia bacterium]|nr:InlB B-repeat-containing protein [Tissierellia bacterium]
NSKEQVWFLEASQIVEVVIDVEGVTTTFELVKGMKVEQPADPAEKVGYTFKGWFTTESMTEAYDFDSLVTKDLTIYAVWEINKYEVKIYDEDGITLLETLEVTYNTLPTPATPSKASTAEYTYEFAGWSPALVVATEATSYKATYTSTVNQYTYIFYDEDGSTVIKEATVDYGSAIVAPNDPSKAATAEHTYTFDKWTPEVPETITEDISFTASYSSTVNQYTVTYKVDGLDDVVDTYEYGATLTIRPNLAKDGYSFSWNPSSLPATMPGENLVVTGTFTVNTYDITYETYFDEVTDPSDFTTLINTYVYGVGVALLDEPTDRISATFEGWYLSDDFSGSAVTSISTTQFGNITLYAKWVTREYTVTFEVEGEEPITKPVKHSHELGTLPIAPVKPGYIFISWRDSNEVEYLATTTITADVTLEAFYIAYIVNDEASLILALSAAEITEIEFSNDVELTKDLDIDRDAFILDTKTFTFDLKEFTIYFKQTTDYQKYELNGLFKDGTINIDNTNGHYELTGMVNTNVTVQIINSSGSTVILNGYWGNVGIDDTNGKTVINATVNEVSVSQGAKLEINEDAVVEKLEAEKEAEVKIDNKAEVKEFDVEEDTDIYFGEDKALTIIFMSEGKAIRVEKIKKGETVKRPVDPIKEDYDFVNWFTTEAMTDAFDFGVAIDENLTIYAQWELSPYKIQFFNVDVEMTDLAQTYKTGDIIIFAIPSIEGHNFLGWFDNQDLSGDRVLGLDSESEGHKKFMVNLKVF